MKKPKIKIICSFNGSFTRRRPSEKLKYTGGETRIIFVDRTITFSRLTARISELIKCPKQAFYLNYMITDSENEEKDSILAVIESDDDVRCMIEGFEKLEFRGKYYRLWIYVCNDDNDEYVNLVNLLKLRNGLVNDVDACDKVKYSDECLRKISKLRNDVVNNVDACDKVKYSDECLRKVVLKQQLVAKKSEFMKRCFRELGLGSEEGEVERGRFSDENCDDFRSPRFGSSLCRSSRDKVECDYDDDKCRESRSYVDSVCHSRGISVKESEDYECDDDNCRESRSYVDSVCLSRTLNVKDGEEDKCDDENCMESRSYVDLVALSASHSRLLDSKDMVDYKCDDINLTERRSYADLAALSVCHSRSVDQKDTVVYKYDDDNFMESRSYADSVLLSASHSRPLILKDRELGVGISESDSTFVNAGDSRKQRIYYSHSISNPSNFTEVGNHRKVRLNGRPCSGKFYPGIQSSSVILKQGKVAKSSFPTPLKPWSDSSSQQLEGNARALQCILNNLTCSFAFPSGSEGNISDNDSGVSQDRNTNPECHFSYHDPPPSIADQSFPSLVDAEKFLVSAEGVNTQIDFLSNGVQKQHTATNQQDVANISSSLNKMELGCNAKLLKIGAVCESFSKNQSGALITHESVNFSSHNLSLLSSDGLESPAHSASGYFSDTLVKPQTMALHLMGQKHFGTGPQAQITNEVVSIFSSDKVMEENKQEAVLQQNVESALSIEKKDEVKKACNESKANGEIPPEIITIYNHLAIGELQAIKNSDLEYIKELDSGTYGTVFYGKWKGSDVAIKKLKPGFFNGGAVEENRLIADFWKEAHILGQLRHPNIVALYGVVTDGPATNLATVTEFMINGSLKQVFRRKDRTIDRRKRLILAMDTAFGMEYLHEKNIVHFDLKSHNLLVNVRDPRRPVCKIGDLGLSKIKQKTLVSGGVRGTIPWMAPELLSCKNLVTEKVDVFSFGIVMWELLTGEEPYSGMRSHEIIAGIIKGTLRPETPAWCDPAWRSLMEKCWSTDPANRPTFSEIAKELRTMAAAMNIK